MNIRCYIHPNLPNTTIVMQNDDWFAVPTTVTTPTVNWGQRRRIRAQDPAIMELMPENSLFVRMLTNAIKAPA